MDAVLKSLEDRFSVPGLRFSNGSGGLIRAVIDTPVASGELYLNGAHVTRYQPAGHAPVLWVSERSHFEAGKPIRGGVPICFPWFGANSKNPNAPAHGLARIASWEIVASGRMADGGVSIELATIVDGFALRYEARFGTFLELILRVELERESMTEKSYRPSPPTPLPEDGARGVRVLGDEQFPTSLDHSRSFEAALHSYFVVADIRQVAIEGLEENAYLDKVGGLERRPATHERIRFSQETDRVYLETNATCTLRDPVMERTITVRQANSRSTIVWNPWIEKSARMPDFGDDEWPGMVCIETANVGEEAVRIEPGQLHTLVALIDVRSIAA